MPTTVTKTIGTGGDYTTLQAWEDASPANLVTSDQIWRGQCFNQEFFSSSAQLLSVSGTTTDATRYKELTTYAGASFVDNASVQTNALRYNASNGAGIRSTYAWSAPVAVNESYFRISKMQISATTAVAFNGGATTGLVMDKCIVENSSTGNEPLKTYGVCTVKNSLIVQRSTATCAALSNGTNVYNCTFVRTGSSTGNIFTGSYGTSTLQNCAFFGGATTLAGGSSSKTYTTCYTDTASPPSGCTTVAYDTSTGSGFQNITDSTRDFRIKSGSALLDVGTTDATNAATDIVGTSRPQGSAYDVGAWELVVTSGPALTGEAVVAAVGNLTPVMSAVLAGSAAAGGQGTLSPMSLLPLTGQATVAAQGSVAPVIMVALTGVGTTADIGTLSVANQDITLPLTGLGTSVAQGTLAPGLSTPITGQATTVALGTVAPGVWAELTGQATTAAVGSVVPQTTVGLTGQAVEGALGTMVVPGDVTAALTGAEVITGLGTLTPVITPDQQPGKSHTDLTIRQMLVDYYTVAFAKKLDQPQVIAEPTAKQKLSRPSAKIQKVLQAAKTDAPSVRAARVAEAAELVAAKVAPDILADLTQSALKFNTLVLDFQAFEREQQRRRERDDADLLLLASVL